MRATSRIVSAGMPQTAAISSGGNALMRSFSASKPSVLAWTYWTSTMPSSTIVWSMPLRSATSRAGLELQHAGRMPAEAGALAARIHDDELGAALGRLLQIGRGDRMVLRRPRADDDDAVGILGRGKGRGDGAGIQALHQRRHGRGVAEPGAVVDIVGVEAGADELLEEIGFLVRALGRAEAGERLAAMRVGNGLQAGGGALQRLLPGRLAEVHPSSTHGRGAHRRASARRRGG